jgi:hypothetical protein
LSRRWRLGRRRLEAQEQQPRSKSEPATPMADAGLPNPGMPLPLIILRPMPHSHPSRLAFAQK